MGFFHFIKQFVELKGGSFHQVDQVGIIRYPVGQNFREVYASQIFTKDGNIMYGITSVVKELVDTSDYLKLLEFAHHLVYTRVSITSGKICVSAVCEARLASMLFVEQLIREVAEVSQQMIDENVG